MTTDPSISIVFENGAGATYKLDTDLYDYGRMRLREEKILPIYLKNDSGSVVNNITVEAVMHPTKQAGSASETYDAMQIGENEAGPWFNILEIPFMSVGELKLIWMNWTMPEAAIPGIGLFAIQVKGDVEYD